MPNSKETLISTTIVSIAFLFMGVSIFYVGFHNVDLGWNIENINCRFNLTLGDYGSDNVLRTGQQLIIIGNNQLFNGLRIVFISVLILVLGVAISYEKAKKEINYKTRNEDEKTSKRTEAYAS